MKSIKNKNVLYLILTLLVLCMLIEIRSGQFFSVNNIVDILRAIIVPGLFALGAFLVLVSGGIDISFPILASLSCFLVTKMFSDMNYQGSIIIPFIVVSVIGLLLGLLNGVLVAHFKILPFIATLGTSSVFKGLLLGTFNAKNMSVLPTPMIDFGSLTLFEVTNSENALRSSLPFSFIILIVAISITYVLLRQTLLGRSIYAVGGNINAAIRIGIRVKWVQIFVYCFVGVISSIAYLIRICMTQLFIPPSLFGYEMFIISAVVLGGASITGGAGTISGTICGMCLMVVMQNSMLLLGIPTYWQDFFVGLLIIIGVSISATKNRRIGKTSSVKA